MSAAALIEAKTSTTDSNLFLIAHLLRLKQQIVAFDIEFVTPEVSFDFSSITNTFYELRERGGLWNPASWVRLAAGGLVPRVVENMLDAKAELDGRLRTSINEFVSSFAKRVTAPLSETSKGNTKAKNDALDPSRATTAVRGLTEKEVPILRRKLAEYIDDTRTRETLVGAVRDQVVLLYEDWVDAEMDDGRSGKKTLGGLSKKGKGREDEVWSSEAFGEWCEKTFSTGRTISGIPTEENGE